MPNVIDTYEGELCARCVHVSSDASVMAEVLRDGFGHDDSFAPPDLISAGLGACLLLTMGLYAKANDIDIKGADAEVSYIWAADNSRLAGFEITLRMPPRSFSDGEKRGLEKCIESAPMHVTLGSIPQKINFVWA